MTQAGRSTDQGQCARWGESSGVQMPQKEGRRLPPCRWSTTTRCWYVQRFTPRRAKSVWSKINRERIERLQANLHANLHGSPGEAPRPPASIAPTDPACLSQFVGIRKGRSAGRLWQVRRVASQASNSSSVSTMAMSPYDQARLG